MAYEYEEIIVKQHLSNFRSKTGKLIDTKESLELREVYAKAKAFNEIVGLRNNHYIESKTNNGTPITVLDAKTFGREVSHLINKNWYREDK